MELTLKINTGKLSNGQEYIEVQRTVTAPRNSDGSRDFLYKNIQIRDVVNFCILHPDCKATMENVNNAYLMHGSTRDVGDIYSETFCIYDQNKYTVSSLLGYAGLRRFEEEYGGFTFFLRHLDEFCTYFVEKIRAQIEASREFTAGSASLILFDEKKENLEAMTIIPDERLVLFSGGKSYILEAKEAKFDTIDKMYKGGVKSMSRIFDAKLMGMRASYQEEIMNLNQQLSYEYKRGVGDGMNLLSIAKSYGWKFDDKTQYLTYTEPIKATHMKYREVIYELPLGSDFIINGVVMKMMNGVHQGTYSYKDENWHSNVSGPSKNNGVCIGDLSGKPLMDLIKKIPSMLTTLGFDSPYWGAVDVSPRNATYLEEYTKLIISQKKYSKKDIADMVAKKIPYERMLTRSEYGSPGKEISHMVHMGLITLRASDKDSGGDVWRTPVTRAHAVN
jgi:hypothetical protein